MLIVNIVLWGLVGISLSLVIALTVVVCLHAFRAMRDE